MTTIQSELAVGDDDFVTEILTRRKRRLPILTAILVLAVAAGGAFIAGAEVQKHYGKSTTAGAGGASAFSALASRFRSGAAGTGAAGAGGGTGRGGFFGAGGAGGGTTGTVTLIKGSTLYVTNSSGTTVLVHTSPASRVTKSVTGSVQTIHPGDTVTVTGAQAANGSYTAAAISIGGGTSG
jgi:hypothetical protein